MEHNGTVLHLDVQYFSLFLPHNGRAISTMNTLNGTLLLNGTESTWLIHLVSTASPLGPRAPAWKTTKMLLASTVLVPPPTFCISPSASSRTHAPNHWY